MDGFAEKPLNPERLEQILSVVTLVGPQYDPHGVALLSRSAVSACLFAGVLMLSMDVREIFRPHAAHQTAQRKQLTGRSMRPQSDSILEKIVQFAGNRLCPVSRGVPEQRKVSPQLLGFFLGPLFPACRYVRLIARDITAPHKEPTGVSATRCCDQQVARWWETKPPGVRKGVDEWLT